MFCLQGDGFEFREEGGGGITLVGQQRASQTVKPVVFDVVIAGDGAHPGPQTCELPPTTLVEDVPDYFELRHGEWDHPAYHKKDIFPVYMRELETVHPDCTRLSETRDVWSDFG